MIVTAADIDICARTVWGEARGEPYEGKLAVAHVLINRWQGQSGQWARDDTLATACLRHRQFSAWNQGDPNFVPLQTQNVAQPVFRDCMRAVLEALNADKDPTAGSRHYHTDSIMPTWARGHEPVARIGHHVFYNDIR